MAETLVIDVTLSGVEKAESQLSGFDAVYDKINKKLNKMSQTQYDVAIQLLDRASPILNQIQNRLHSITNGNWQIRLDAKAPSSYGIQQAQGANGGIAGSISSVKGSIPLKSEVVEKASANSALMDTASTVLELGATGKKVYDVGKFFGDGFGLIKGAAGGAKAAADGVKAAADGAKAAGVVTAAGGKASTSLATQAAASWAGAGAAAGAAGMAGAAVGGITLFAGIENLYKGYKSEDETESAAHKALGGSQVGGVAAGAAIGSLILPGVGTAIGAGIGGIVGWVHGEKKKSEIEQAGKQADRAQREAQSKFGSETLKEAIVNEDISAEQFNQLFQQEVIADMSKKFDGAQMSLENIRKTAELITFKDANAGIQQFSDASAQAQNSLANLSGEYSAMDKANWKMGLEFADGEAKGLSDKENVAKFSNEQIEGYKAQAQSTANSAQVAMEDRHYQASMAMDVLLDDSKNPEIKGKINDMYAGFQDEIESKNAEIQAILSASPEGELSKADFNKVTGLQDDIKGITEQTSGADMDANKMFLQAKYGGENMDLSSFQQMQSELQAQAAAAVQSEDEALEIGIKNLKLALDSGAIDNQEFEAGMQEITEKYHENIDKIGENIGDFQLDNIAEAFQEDLMNAMDGVDGDFGDVFKEKIKGALENGEDLVGMDPEQLAKIFDIEDTTGMEESLAELQTMVAAYLQTLPEGLNTEGSNEFAGEYVDGIFDDYMKQIQEMAESADTDGIAATFQEMLGRGLLDTDAEGADDFIAGYMEQINSAIQAGETGDLGNIIGEMFNQSLEQVGPPVLPDNIGEYGRQITEGLLKDTQGIDAACTELRGNVDKSVKSAFDKPVDVSTSVNMTANYKLNNPTFTVSGSGMVSINPENNANGSLVDHKILTWVGEEGPEAIIPLVPGRRKRGLALWEKAGEMLGVGKHANGGIVGGTESFMGGLFDENPGQEIAELIKHKYEAPIDEFEESSNDYTGTLAPSSKDEESGSPNVAVNVNVSPNFDISGSDSSEEDIVEVIRKHMKDMADDLGGEIAANLEKVFSNMPLGEV